MRGLGLGLGLDLRGARRGGGQAAPRVAGNNKVSILGDSRSGWMGSPAGQYNGRYPHTIARQKLRGRMHSGWYDTFQTGGLSVAQIQANHFPSVMASDAKTCVFLGGINTSGNNTPDDTARIAAMAAEFTARGPDYCFVIADEGPPGAGWGGNLSGLIQLRDNIRAMEDKPAGIYIWPLWRAITGGDDGSTARAWAYMTGDQVHHASIGAYYAGEALAAVLDEILPPYDLFGQPLLLGPTWALGSLASNDLATNRLGSGGSYTASMVEFEDEVWAQVALTSVDGGVNLYRNSSAIPPELTVGTSIVQLNIDFVILAGGSGLRNVSAGVYKQSGGMLNASTPGSNGGADGQHSGSSSQAAIGPYPDVEMRGTLWSAPQLLDAAATQLRPWWCAMVPLTVMTKTILFRRPQLRVLN